jgi:hypothetical protein
MVAFGLLIRASISKSMPSPKLDANEYSLTRFQPRDQIRPGLRDALDFCRVGDVLAVRWLDRLGRSLPDLPRHADIN